MKTKTIFQKRALYNGYPMAAAIVVILAAAVLAVGSISRRSCWAASAERSWDGPERRGRVYCPKQGGRRQYRAGRNRLFPFGRTQLRDGDTVETLNGSSIELKSGEDWIFVNENSEFTLHMEGDGMALSLPGRDFAVAGDSLEIRAMDARDWLDAGASLGKRALQQREFLLFCRRDCPSGQQDWRRRNGKRPGRAAVHSGSFSLNTLNDFQMESVRRAGEKTQLCFYGSADRRAAG